MATLWPLWSNLGPSWGHLRATLGPLGVMAGFLESSWVASWSRLRATLEQHRHQDKTCENLSAWSRLRDTLEQHLSACLLVCRFSRIVPPSFPVCLSVCLSVFIVYFRARSRLTSLSRLQLVHLFLGSPRAGCIRPRNSQSIEPESGLPWLFLVSVHSASAHDRDCQSTELDSEQRLR